MIKKTSTHFTLSSAFLGLMLSTLPCQAQSKMTGLRGINHRPFPTSQVTTQAAGTPPAISASYAFTVLNFPGTLQTVGFGINSGAASSKIEIVGAVGTNASPGPIGYTGGFLMHYAKAKGTTVEAFGSVNFPGAIQQVANGVNDSGEIVGFYEDSSGVVHGYLESGGVFTTIDVPFSGATATGPEAINNSGEIVGIWDDATTSHGFLLSGGTYTSFDYPGAVLTEALDMNNSGEIVGDYVDATGIQHGFSLSGGIYAIFDPPGSTATGGNGINDAGEIVGSYCVTSECAANFATLQGFVLSGGTYTTIAIPGATETIATQINDKGVIVGLYVDTVGNSGFLAFSK